MYIRTQKYSVLFFLSFFLSTFMVAQETPDADTPFEKLKLKIHKAYFFKPKQTIPDCKQLLKIAKTNEEVYDAYRYLGYVYNLSGESDTARYYLEKKILFSRKFKDVKFFSGAVIDYANADLQNINTQHLFSLLYEALRKLNSTDNKQDKGLIYMLLGDMYLDDKDYKKAGFYYDRCFENIEGKYVKVDYYQRMGDLNLVKEDYLTAQKFYFKELGVLPSKDIFAYPLSLQLIGYTYLKLGQPDVALKYLSESLKIQKEKNFYEYVPDTYYYLALVEKRKGNLTQEKDYLQKAEQSFKEQDNFFGLKKCYLAQSNFFSRINNYLKEEEYLEKYESLAKKLYNKEKAAIMLDVEAKYKLKDSEDELLLKEQILKKESKLRKVYQFAGVLILILSLVIILFYLNRIKIERKLFKNSMLLQDEKLRAVYEKQKIELIKTEIKSKGEERLKLSKNLHDGIASDLAALKIILTSSDEVKKEDVHLVVSRIDRIYEDIRSMSHDLVPNYISEIKFSQLVQQLCDTPKQQNINTKLILHKSEEINQYNESILFNIYRILQESITNVIKHSNATELIISLIPHENILNVSVEDNGKGIEKEKKSGIGLKNIKDRVERLNGDFSVEYGANGFSTLISIPIYLDKNPNLLKVITQLEEEIEA